jgi:hypothetical protein
MSRCEFRSWRKARGYVHHSEVVADLRTPVATLSNLESGLREVPAAIARMCRMIDLLDDVARTATNDPEDRRTVLLARTALASWSPPRDPRSVPASRRGWDGWRTDRLCALAALVARVAFSTRSAALRTLRARARDMVSDWGG